MKVDGFQDVGLSYEERPGGRFVLRWRQFEQLPDGGRERRQRSWTAYGLEERRRMEDVIGSALRRDGYWRPPDEAPALPVVADAERAAADWVAWKSTVKRCAPSTRGNLARAMKRFFHELRAVRGLEADEPVPVTALSPAALNAVTARWQVGDRYGEGTIYQTLAAVVDMWAWVADDPDRYHATPRPPYNLDRVMPPQPMYEAPEAVPTWSEVDACLRRIRLPFPRRLAIVMRYTGLRLEQAAHVHREDLDLEGATLLVRKGKSRREQLQRRRVPVSAHLISDLAELLAELRSGPLFPDLMDPAIPIRAPRNQTRYVTEAWEAATLAGEARRDAWAPPSRRKARPDHAFRAALQGALEAEGFAGEVVDHLVGHAPRTTRGKHYTPPSPHTLRRAVDAIPAVDWRDTAPNIVHFARRSRR